VKEETAVRKVVQPTGDLLPVDGVGMLRSFGQQRMLTFLLHDTKTYTFSQTATLTLLNMPRDLFCIYLLQKGG